jgi:AraC-like DNA-binding protein
VHRKLSYVKSTLTFIRRKHKEHITLNQICDYVGLDKFYLCHLFKQITGETIVEYINFIRCEYAKKYLASGDFTVIECAEQSGFPDSSYFSRVYKRYMGVLPSEELPNKKEIL